MALSGVAAFRSRPRDDYTGMDLLIHHFAERQRRRVRWQSAIAGAGVPHLFRDDQRHARPRLWGRAAKYGAAHKFSVLPDGCRAMFRSLQRRSSGLIWRSGYVITSSVGTSLWPVVRRCSFTSGASRTQRA